MTSSLDLFKFLGTLHIFPVAAAIYILVGGTEVLVLIGQH